MKNQRGGFTLLEVLLTLVLSATLMTGLWSVYSIYLKLFETGQARTERTQLARALLQQIADDLQSAIEDSPGRDSTSAGEKAGSVRRFGLLGTHDSLRIDVLQVIPLEESPELDEDVSTRFREAPTRQVPELRTVFYTFRDRNTQREAETESTSSDPLDNRAGLTRRELDYETPADEREPSRTTLANDTVLGESGREIPTEESSDERFLPIDLEDDSMIWAPEVAKLRFRYFDGNGWSSRWNSIEQKSLPVAVEVTMQLDTLDQADWQRAADEELALDDELLEEEKMSQPTGSTHRLVIDLPGARKRQDVRRHKPQLAASSFAAPAPLAVPRAAAPPPMTPRRPAAVEVPQSDQWMRVSQ